MTDENGVNIDNKRKCKDPLKIDREKIIKSEVEETIEINKATNSHEPLQLFLERIIQTTNAEIKPELYLEQNIDKSNDVTSDNCEGTGHHEEGDVKPDLFEESETCIQFNNEYNTLPQANISVSKEQLEEAKASINDQPQIKPTVHQVRNLESKQQLGESKATVNGQPQIKRNVTENDTQKRNSSEDKTLEENSDISVEKKLRTDHLSSEIVEVKKILDALQYKTNIDEYEVFVKFIAHKIRNLKDMTTREIVMNEIYSLIFQSAIKDKVQGSSNVSSNPS